MNTNEPDQAPATLPSPTQEPQHTPNEAPATLPSPAQEPPSATKPAPQESAPTPAPPEVGALFGSHVPTETSAIPTPLARPGSTQTEQQEHAAKLESINEALRIAVGDAEDRCTKLKRSLEKQTKALATAEERIETLNDKVFKTPPPVVKRPRLIPAWLLLLIGMGAGGAGAYYYLGQDTSTPPETTTMSTSLPAEVFSEVPCSPVAYIVMISTSTPPETTQSGDFGPYVEYRTAQRAVKAKGGSVKKVKMSKIGDFCSKAAAKHTKITDASVRFVWAGPFATAAEAKKWRKANGFTATQNPIISTN